MARIWERGDAYGNDANREQVSWHKIENERRSNQGQMPKLRMHKKY
jgi:hypothetical protein